MSDRQAETTTVEPARRGFGDALRCIHCGADGNVTLFLADMTDTSSVHCNGCDADCSLDDVREAVEAWQRVLAWVALSPVLED